jgi:mono/diheme cytochrome c family protein
MRKTKPFRVLFATAAAMALTSAACAPPDQLARSAAPTASAPDEAGRSSTPAAGPLPTGASIATMSDQYAHPRRGQTAAAGASSWVAPAPAPAFVLGTPLPPADPPAPVSVAVANRQPAPRATSAPPTQDRAVSPAPAAAAASAAEVDLARGRRLFADYACGGCHVLADAGGSGGIGPALDGNPRMSQGYVHDAIAEGRGAMPAFAGQMSAEEIGALSAYIVQVARR